MSEENPKISVILPSLNVQEYIEECIESVINQTLEDIEILCIDAGSDDGTLEILKKYAKKDSRIKIYLSSRKSYGNQVNQGIINAKGEYIAIVETDDYIASDMFEKLYELTQLSYIDIVKSTFYHVNEIDGKRTLKVDTVKSKLLQGKYFNVNNEPLFLEGHPSIWAGIYKRHFLEKNNIEFIEEDGGGWVDNPFFYETALKARTIMYTNKPYYYYRENNVNSSTNNLKDKSIPPKRIRDMFNVLRDCECENQLINEMLYRRLFRYIEIILEDSDDEEDNLDYETVKVLNEVLKLVDKDYVHKKLSNTHQKYYYKYASPLILSKFEH